MAYPYGGGITCLSNHGTTEPRNHGIHGIHGIPARMGTEYPEGGIIVAHWEARNIVCVFCVFSGPLIRNTLRLGGTTAPRNTRNTQKAALLWRFGGKKHRLCILCVQWSSIRNIFGLGGNHGIPARMGTESSCEWLIVNFTGSHAACSGCCWGIKR